MSQQSISRLPRSLKKLKLYSSNITDELLGTLPPKLTRLELGKCPDVTEQGLSKLPPSVKWLSFENPDLTDECLQYLPSTLDYLGPVSSISEEARSTFNASLNRKR
jgi:hypothetical protein